MTEFSTDPGWRDNTYTDTTYVGVGSAEGARAAQPAYDQESASDSADRSKAGAAKEQASAVGQGAAQAGAQVASVAKDQAQNVVSEAGSQAKDLLGQARSELTEQAGAQQKRLMQTLRSLGDELESMGQHSQEPGMATDLVKQASGRAHDAASWLESREPGSLLSELQSFARQRPAAFIALAAGAGLVAGRLGRGVKDATGDDSSASGPAAGAGAGQSGYASGPALAGGVGGVGAEESRPFASSQDSAYQDSAYQAGAYQGVSSSEGGL
jgi:ElaB/YqjD/DUF883 family membrane-anchored ribosome-binding protein